MRAVLPSLSHFRREDYFHIYEPSDDTYLLCDALLQEALYIKALSPLYCLEIGSGSGTVITYLSQLLQLNNIFSIFIATDINPYACINTKRTASSNNCHIDCINTSFASCISPNTIDVLVFNPPYVPTPNEEVTGNGIEASWAGGDNGRLVIDRFLPLIDSILSSRGVLYMVLVDENKPKEILDILHSYSFKASIILKKRAANEQLMIVKACREEF